MIALIAMQTNNKEETSKAGFMMQRKIPKFKYLYIDICMQIRQLTLQIVGISAGMTQLPAHRWLLVAEMPQARLVVPGLQLLPQRGKGCCGARVLPSCAALLDIENEQNVTGCQCPGKQVKALVNLSGLESYSQSDTGFWVN